ncbi:glycosyltransferase family protein [Salinispora vitiensis]|uniref:hypothetical protein n=1 Tax=Salinispora vitiensis TaxID=999544 RepID=UPI0004B75B2F|nr:hypothetical protein [Salinispora vitiensis]
MTSLKRGLVPLLVALAWVGLWAVALRPAVDPTNDGYRYARMALELLGESPDDAQRDALTAYCGKLSRVEARRASVDPLTMYDPPQIVQRIEACIAQYPDGLTPNEPRYEAIFNDRIGYPALTTPLVAILGVNAGLTVTSVLCTAIGGLLIVRLLRELGVPLHLAVAGQIAYYGSPIGYWGAYPLTEGPAMALTVAALLGAVWLLRQRTAAGASLLLGALATGAVLRFSTFLLVAGGLAAAGLLILATSRRHRHLGTGLVVGIGGVTTVGILTSVKLLGLSGAGETLQDKWTNHFTRPDVADPWQRLVDLNVTYWSQWLQQELGSPWLLLGLGFGAWALLRHDRALGWLTLAVASTGLATQVAHPVVSQGNRLHIALWLVPVVGIPLLLARREWARRPGEPSAPVAAAPTPLPRPPSEFPVMAQK